MVSDTHPHDIELFEYVEDELPEARRDEIAAHLATCGVCAEQVGLAAAGRIGINQAENQIRCRRMLTEKTPEERAAIRAEMAEASNAAFSAGLACDTVANIDFGILDQMADAAAVVAVRLAG